VQSCLLGPVGLSPVAAGALLCPARSSRCLAACAPWSSLPAVKAPRSAPRNYMENVPIIAASWPTGDRCNRRVAPVAAASLLALLHSVRYLAVCAAWKSAYNTDASICILNYHTTFPKLLKQGMCIYLQHSNTACRMLDDTGRILAGCTVPCKVERKATRTSRSLT